MVPINDMSVVVQTLYTVLFELCPIRTLWGIVNIVELETKSSNYKDLNYRVSLLGDFQGTLKLCSNSNHTSLN